MSCINKNYLCHRIVLTVLLMAAGFVFGLGTKDVLAAGKYYKIGMNDSVDFGSDESGYDYICFSPKKDGAITFSVIDDCVGVTLTKKTNGVYKVLPTTGGEDFITNGKEWTEDSLYGGEETVTYGVKKGVKYALRVSEEGSHTIYSSFKRVEDNGGKKKGSAKTTKKGKSLYGMLPVGGKNRSRWYKFKVPKTKKVTVQFKGYTNSFFNYQMIMNGKVVLDRYVYNNNWDDTPGKEVNGYVTEYNNKTKKMTARLKKGSVVYVKITGKTKGTGGYYYLKWN